jgi:hypothetical protein
MHRDLLDAAFRLVSHSLVAGYGMPPDLKSQFPYEEPHVLQDALAQARRLEEVAIELAEAARGPANDHREPLNAQLLSERCPGFSGESYSWAINDGYTLTR